MTIFIIGIIFILILGVSSTFTMINQFDDWLDEQAAIVGPTMRRRLGATVPGDDIIDSCAEPPLWTELDDYQLRRLLDGSAS